MDKLSAGRLAALAALVVLGAIAANKIGLIPKREGYMIFEDDDDVSLE